MKHLTLQDIAHLVESGEAEAFADVFRAAPPQMRLRVERIGSAIALIAPTVPIILFNRVIGLGLNEPATEQMVDDIVALYQREGIATFAIQPGPLAQPAALGEWLTARGFAYRDNWAKVYRAAQPLVEVASNLRIERVAPERAGEFATPNLAAFGMPPLMCPWIEAMVGRAGWHHYVAYDSDEPVATGALFVKGKVGWLGLGGTVPSHRRRGGQGALMARRIRDAAALGCEWLVTETGEDTPERPNPSFHNMLRTGFTLAYQRPNYIFPN